MSVEVVFETHATSEDNEAGIAPSASSRSCQRGATASASS